MADTRTADTDQVADRRAPPPVRIAIGEQELDVEVAALVRQWADSSARSAERRQQRRHERRRARARRAGHLVLGAVALGGAYFAATHLPSIDGLSGPATLEPPRAALASVTPQPAAYSPAGSEQVAATPARRQLAGARAFAHSRDGLVSFAVVDSRGREHALSGDRRYVSASVVKAMLLVAELERLRAEDAPLDAATESTLRAMITYSDNDAADSIYYRVGDEGLDAVARAAGMARFQVSGYWANAQLTAADMARMFARLDRLTAGPHREFALGLLGSIIPAQSWGIPVAAGEGWAVRFKGGWRGTERGQLVHQVAELRRGDTELSLAVLTDGNATMAYGIETVRGIAERLLSDPRRPARGARERPWSARWGS